MKNPFKINVGDKFKVLNDLGMLKSGDIVTAEKYMTSVAGDEYWSVIEDNQCMYLLNNLADFQFLYTPVLPIENLEVNIVLADDSLGEIDKLGEEMKARRKHLFPDSQYGIGKEEKSRELSDWWERYED